MKRPETQSHCVYSFPKCACAGRVCALLCLSFEFQMMTPIRVTKTEMNRSHLVNCRLWKCLINIIGMFCPIAMLFERSGSGIKRRQRRWKMTGVNGDKGMRWLKFSCIFRWQQIDHFPSMQMKNRQRKWDRKRQCRRPNAKKEIDIHLLAVILIKYQSETYFKWDFALHFTFAFGKFNWLNMKNMIIKWTKTTVR